MHDVIPLSSLNKVSGPPRLQDIQMQFSAEGIEQLEEIITHYPN